MIKIAVNGMIINVNNPSTSQTKLHLKKMKYFFRLLAKINKLCMPSLREEDLSKLNNYEKALLSYRYWVTKNSL